MNKDLEFNESAMIEPKTPLQALHLAQEMARTVDMLKMMNEALRAYYAKRERKQ